MSAEREVRQLEERNESPPRSGSKNFEKCIATMMNKYIDQILNEPDLFISDHVSDGIDKGIVGVDKIDVWIPNVFPIHTILYLLRANGCESEIGKVKKKHSERFAKEREFMCRLAGVEAIDTEGFSKIKKDLEIQIDGLRTENADLQIRKADLLEKLAQKDEKIKELEEQIKCPKPKVTRNDDLWFDPETKELRFNGYVHKFVDVEGGSFMMGASEYDSDAFEDEKPQHEVTLDSFAIGETQVTQALWKAVVLAWKKDLEQKGLQGTDEYSSLKEDPSKFKGANRPVECVSWDDCQYFIKILNELTGQKFSLPTEAEWEYAARGGKHKDNYKYSGSDTIDKVAWYGKSDGETHPVKLKNRNRLGLYDMTGNVWEWCEDWFDSSYYSGSIKHNPSGPSSGSFRVDRGGGYCNGAWGCRVSYRGYFSPGDRYCSLGLRLVLRS